MSTARSDFAESPVIVCRTGDTGEHGYVLIAPAAVLGDLSDALLPRVASVGGCPTITPVEVGLGWAIGWDKPEFAGRGALLDSSSAVGAEVAVDVRGRESRFNVVKPPFVQPSAR